ncbi:MAG: hypothetical protein ACJAZ1_003432 [Yoonia sp.]|jgi:hypothetical protein
MHFDSSPSLNARLPLMPLIYCPNLPDPIMGGGWGETEPAISGSRLIHAAFEF